MLILRRQGGGQPDPHGKCGCKIVGGYRHTGPSRTQTASGLMSPCYNRLEGSRRGEFNSDRSLHVAYLGIPQALRTKTAVGPKRDGGVEMTCARHKHVLLSILPAHCFIPTVSVASSSAQMLVPALAELFKTSYPRLPWW